MIFCQSADKLARLNDISRVIYVGESDLGDLVLQREADQALIFICQ